MSIPSVAQLESMPPKLEVEKPIRPTTHPYVSPESIYHKNSANWKNNQKDCRCLLLVFGDAGNMMLFLSVGLDGTVTWTVSSFCASGPPTYWWHWTVLVRIIGVDRDQCDTCPSRAVTGHLLVKGATAENTDAATQISYRHLFYMFLVLEGFPTENRKCKTLMISQCVKLN